MTFVKRIAAALLLLGGLVLSAEDFGPVSIDLVPPMLPARPAGGNYYNTYEFRITNKSTRPVEISFSLNIRAKSSFSIERTVLVPPGATGNTSLYYPATIRYYAHDISLNIFIDRAFKKHNMTSQLWRHYGRDITALVSPSLKMADYQKLRLVPYTAETTSITLLQWGRHLRDYMGLAHLYLLWGDKLHPQSEAAIMQWVRLGGNLTFIVEADAPWPEGLPGADKGLHQIQLDWGTITYCRPISPTYKKTVAEFLKENTKKTSHDDMWAGIGGNNTDSQPDENLKLGKAAEFMNSHMALPVGDPLRSNIEFKLLPDMTAVPLRLLFVVMLFFVILIGPLNFWYLRRRKREPWILVTTPAISLVFCILVILFITFHEGWYSRGRAVAVTLLDQGEQLAVTKAWMAVYAPISPRGGFNFRHDDCLAFYNTGSPRLNLNESQYYSSGLLIPRVPLIYALDRVESRRERLQIQGVEGKQLRLVNGLGGALVSLAVVGGDGSIYHSQGAVEAGAATALPASGMKSATRELSAQTLKNSFDHLPADIGIMNLAAALPPGYYVALAEAPLFFTPGTMPKEFPVQQYIIGKYDSSGDYKNAN